MELLEEVRIRAERYLEAAAIRRVAPDCAALAGLDRFRESLPEMGTPDRETLELLDEAGSPATVASAGSRYFGFVIGGALPAALASNWLASAWDQNGGMSTASPVSAALEEIVIGWTLEALRFDSTCYGALVSGATMANFCGLAAARHALLAREGWNVEERGLFGAPEITVIVGAETHASLLKALAMLGLGRSRVVTIDTDDQGRIRPECLPQIPNRSIVCLQAGNVNTGSFDAATEVCNHAHAAGAWVHVDGAFGLWARVSRAFDRLTAGYELADSWAVDNHKWLNVNYDSAFVLTRDPAHLAAAFATSGAYLIEGKPREPMYCSPELSRRARAVDVWAAMKSLGRSGLADLIDRTCRYARLFADELSAGGCARGREMDCEILNDVVINQVLVRFGESDAITGEVVRRVQQDGTCWCGGTVWHGKAAMRISVSSWRTTEEDIRLSAAAILRCAQAVTKGRAEARGA